MAAAEPRMALWSLLIGNFVIGTGVLLPAGLLNQLSADLDISVATAGLLITIGGLVVGIGAPLFAGLTSAIDRRHLLAFCMALYAAGHFASALAPDFATLAIVRAVMIVSAAIFTPQAAATLGLVLPADRRAAGIAFIFIGWSAASVIGIPAGSLIAAAFGWRAAYAVAGLACLIPLVLVWRAVAPGLKVPPLSLASWRAAFGNPVIVVALGVTLASAWGQFTLFSYLAPVLKRVLAAEPGTIAMLFALFGVAGIAGNALASAQVGRIGIDRAILAAILLMTAGAIVFSLSFGNFTGAVAAVVIWGLGTFSANSLQQSRLAAAAPALASASIALNTSVLYIGQALGAASGGRLIADGVTPSITWVAASLLALSAMLSVAASKLARRA